MRGWNGGTWGWVLGRLVFLVAMGIFGLGFGVRAQSTQTSGWTAVGGTDYPDGGMSVERTVSVAHAHYVQPQDPVIDSGRGLAYYVESEASSSDLVKSDLATGTTAGRIQLPASFGWILGVDPQSGDVYVFVVDSAVDAGTLYRYAKGASNGPPELVGSLQMQSGQRSVSASAFDWENNRGWLCFGSYTPTIVAISLGEGGAAMTLGASLTLPENQFDFSYGARLFADGVHQRLYLLFGIDALDCGVISLSASDSQMTWMGQTRLLGSTALDNAAVFIGLVPERNAALAESAYGRLIRIDLGEGETLPQVGAGWPLSEIKSSLARPAYDPVSQRLYVLSDGGDATVLTRFRIISNESAPVREASINVDNPYRTPILIHSPGDSRLYFKDFVESGGDHISIVNLAQAEFKGVLRGSEFTLDRPATLDAAYVYDRTGTQTMSVALYSVGRQRVRIWGSQGLSSNDDHWMRADIKPDASLPARVTLQPGRYLLAWRLKSNTDAPAFLADAEAVSVMAPLNSDGSFPLVLDDVTTEAGAWSSYVSWHEATVAAAIRVPEDYPTIQLAIDAVADGGRVVVAPGVYRENLFIKGKNITLTSVDPTDAAIVAATVVDGGGAGSVVTFDGTESPACVVTGMTFRNGKMQNLGEPNGGGGMLGYGTHATVRGNHIVENLASDGGGIYDCDGLIENNFILNNRAAYPYSAFLPQGDGGGIDECDGVIRGNTLNGNRASLSGGAIANGSARIEGNRIEYNSGKQGSALAFLKGDVTGNTIRENFGPNSGHGSIYGVSGAIRNNLIVRNHQPAYPVAGTYTAGLEYCSGAIEGNTLVDNGIDQSTTSTQLVFCSGPIRDNIIWSTKWTGGSALSNCSEPNYCDIVGWSGGGEGNLSLDPKFVDAANGDFHLTYESPCIDAGYFLTGTATDLEGNPRGIVVRVHEWVHSNWDIGAYEFVPPDLELLSPAGAATWNVGQQVSLGWRSRTVTAGTAVRFELWEAGHFVANLGTDWNPNGVGTLTATVPDVPEGDDYSLRLVSTWNPDLRSESVQPLSIRSAGTAKSTVAPEGWVLYR